MGPLTVKRKRKRSIRSNDLHSNVGLATCLIEMPR
jgi:hypothetical protein